MRPNWEKPGTITDWRGQTVMLRGRLIWRSASQSRSVDRDHILAPEPASEVLLQIRYLGREDGKFMDVGETI